MKSLLAVGAACALLSGCAGAGVMIAGAGAGVVLNTGIEHTMSGITYKTFAAPVKDVRTAALKTLKDMSMTVTADGQAEKDWAIVAGASERTINIELEPLTATATRMRVTVDKGEIFFKDAATGAAILVQTAQALDDAKTAAARTPVQKTATRGGKRT